MYTYHASAKVCLISHHLSSEGSKTPNQLFFEGITFQRQIGTEKANVTAAGNLSDIDLQYNDPVSVPGNSFKPCPVLFSLAISRPIGIINPTWKGTSTLANIVQ